MSANFNLRGIPPEVMSTLKRKAKKSKTSVNALILTMVERGLGFSAGRFRYHDLDHLAGTWSAADVKEFNKNTEFFEQIDEEMWK